jgi:hypothetical protein
MNDRPGAQYLQDIIDDGSGGAILCWLDASGASWDIRAQHVNGAGSLSWGAAGVVVCDASGDQFEPRLAADGSGGAFVAWLDGRMPPVEEVRVQHVLVSGNASWTDDGVTDVLVALRSAVAAVDGVHLSWQIAKSMVSANLEKRTPEEGWRMVETLESTPAGEIAFIDRDVKPEGRYGYRLRVLIDGRAIFSEESWVVVPGIESLVLNGALPNPAKERLAVSFSLPDSRRAVLELFDISGRRVSAREVGALGPGRHVVDLAHETSIRPGVYLLRLSHPIKTLTEKLVIAR